MSHLITTVRRNPETGTKTQEGKLTLKAIMKSIAALVMLAFATPAFAGGVSVFDNGESKLKFETTVFSDLSQTKTTDLATADTKLQGLSVSRAYLTGKFSFNNDWMMRVTTDVNLDSVLTKKNNNIFLKYAYVQGKLYGDAVVLRLGQSHTPWIDHEEHLWGRRYVSTVLIDTNHYDASSDLGIGLKGKVADGMVNYWVTYTNGHGYDHPAITGSSMDLDSRIGLNLIEGLTLDFQYRNGYKGTKTTPQSTVTPATKSTLYQIMATYGIGHLLRIGVNYATNKTNTAITATNVREIAYDIWGWGKFADQFGALGRYEYVKDDKASASQKKKIRYVAGVEYFPTRNVTLSLIYDFTRNIKGGVIDNTKGKVTKIGLYSEFKY
jgi:opacity protein-like surface antigen